MGLHWQELVILMIVALVIFGPRRLPEIGKSVGESVREFKDSLTGTTRTVAPVEARVVEDTPAPATTTVNSDIRA